MGANQDEIEHAATLAHAHDFIMEFPDQYQTQVFERTKKNHFNILDHCV